MNILCKVILVEPGDVSVVQPWSGRVTRMRGSRGRLMECRLRGIFDVAE